MMHDLLVASALMLVIEGILPFLSPNAMRRLMGRMLEADDRALRTTGLISMIAGVGLLYLIN